MDAVAYQMSFDKEQLALLCANYDRRIDSLGAENKRLKAENAKLRELLGGVGHLLFILDVDYCVACPRDSISHPCPVYTIKGGECLYKSDMRELGVVVE